MDTTLNRPLSLLLPLLLLLLPSNVGAQFGGVVLDPSNLAQNIISATETAATAASTAESLITQTAQLERMVTDGVVPAVYIWDRYNQTLDRWKRVSEKATDFKFDTKKFTDLNYYRRSPCYGPDVECNAKQWDAFLKKLRDDDEEARKATHERAVDALERLKQSQRDTVREVEQLRELQLATQSVQGQLEALQHANEFASMQIEQLIALRNELNQVSQALIADQQRRAQKEATQEATGRYYRQRLPEGEERQAW